MRFQEADAGSKAEPVRIAPRHSESGSRNVTCVDDGRGQFLSERHSDAAGARADIDDCDAFAREFGGPAGAEFTNREAIQSDLDDMLGFWTGDQHVGSHLKL